MAAKTKQPVCNIPKKLDVTCPKCGHERFFKFAFVVRKR